MRKVMIFVIACILAFGITIPKLYKVAQIKQWLPGAITSKQLITQKWHQSSEAHPEGRDTYWIAWTEEDIHIAGNHRLNLTYDKWLSLQIADEIKVVYVKGDETPYLHDGIFVSLENIMFDLVLLLVELGVISFSLLSFIKIKQKETTTD